MLSKADNHIKPYTHLKPIRSDNKVKSDLQHLSNGLHNYRNEVVKSHSPPKIIKSQSQPETSKAEPMTQNVKAHKDIIMVKHFF